MFASRDAGAFVFVGVWLACSAFGVAPTLAEGDDPPGSHFVLNENKRNVSFEAKVRSTQDGVWIDLKARQSSPGVSDDGPAEAQPAARSSGGSPPAAPPASDSATPANQTVASQHTYRVQPINIGNALFDWFIESRKEHPDSYPASVFRDDTYQGILWLPLSTPPGQVQFTEPPSIVNALPSGNGGSTDPREVAIDALGHLPLPDIRVRMNPNLGLVAMPGWFWVDGYDGSALGTSRTVSLPPAVGPEVPLSAVPAGDPRRQGTSFTVDVRIWPTRYEWSFGDGGSLVSQTLGRPYPAESDVQHRYEFSSLRFADGFPVRLTIAFAAEFRVNGGAPQGLPAIQRTYGAGYRVQEIQPVLTAG